MLRKLTVRNYVLIDSLETEFPEGLIIITGQTGAGKSILLGALSLLLGAKADASMIGESSENCVVEGEFQTDKDDRALKSLFEENDIDWDDGRITIRRVVNPTGRSRSFINDSPVQVQLLASLSSRLVDIHSQHQTLLLSDRSFQMSLLDHFASDRELLLSYQSHFRKCNAIRKELEEIEAALSRARSEYEYDRARLDKLVSAGLKENELEELEQEQKQLANAEEIKENLCSAENLLTSVRTQEGEAAVTSLMRDASRHLEKVSSYIPAAASLAERLESCRLELDDILSELSSVNAGTEVSEERLSQVEDRLSMLYSLMRSFSCSTVGDLIAERDSIEASISGIATSDERREELESELKQETAALDKAAAMLSDARKSAAVDLSAAIRDVVRSMELPDAEFRISVSPAPKSADGADAVIYEFSSTGRNLADLSKCASGGEMSRIMLALKSIMAEYAQMPTMIFDEIDTGVSGSVADKMGSVICGMGAHMQVFAITHLPQVAAKGKAHYLVTKSASEDGRAVSEIKRLSDEQRVLEIARMLSGSVLTDAAVANAKELLSFG